MMKEQLETCLVQKTSFVSVCAHCPRNLVTLVTARDPGIHLYLWRPVIHTKPTKNDKTPLPTELELCFNGWIQRGQTLKIGIWMSKGF